MTAAIFRTFAVALAVAILAGADWLHFRGTDNSGVAATARVPVGWAAGKSAKDGDAQRSAAKDGDAKDVDAKDGKPRNIAW